MLTVHQITKTYDLNLILHQVSFSLLPGQRLGLVGQNGTGKTTLLRIIAGNERPDSGTVQLTPATTRLGYLPQGQIEQLGGTIGSFLDQVQGDLDRLADRLSELASALASAPDDPVLHQAYADTLARLESASERTGSAAAVLAALELDGFERETPIAHLSGGQKTRLALGGVLLSRPQVLLLDEPTNHLDFAMLEWLEDWLLA
ncbi:MAG TPA: ATP-binding cassette domain-containing protein, partial [Anaerolineaceae bacterium]|nr:ATP-binding cassette domain-containing protein [Anaerolineaceae bacterium]